MNAHVLVVDDEPDIRELVSMTLQKMGLSAETAINVASARRKLEAGDYDLVITDMRMPDGSGLDVVESLRRRGLNTPVAVITAYGDADQAVAALKAGAFDYIQKPLTLAHLRTLVKSALPAQSAPESLPAPPQPVQTPDAINKTPTPSKPIKKSSASLTRLLGETEPMQTVRAMIGKIAHSMVPVYISGESGTGKEQAARSVHELSERRNGPFVAVNCGAIPENLMESEFFGYKKGSFTGADSDRIGHFQAAQGGTLFLDEVADLPLSMQVKLLRAIQEKAVRRIGESTETPTDVRIISATHKNLEQEVSQGRFRQDLFYRLNVVTLTMPSLRSMRQDLPMYIKSLLAKHEAAQIHIEPEAARALLSYDYPGNFRELENILERALALSGFEAIRVRDLHLNASEPVFAQTPSPSAPDSALTASGASVMQTEQVVRTADAASIAGFDFGRTMLQDYLDDIERQLIQQALEKTRYNRTQAAKLLGVTFRSIRYRMERLGIE